MRVRRKLQINAAVSALVAIAVILLLLMGIYRVNNAFYDLTIAEEILNSSFERSTLQADYLRTGNERAKVQWFAAHEQIGRNLKIASGRFDYPEFQHMIREMIQDHESTTTLFISIVENREKAQAGAVSYELSRSIENRLLTQVNIRLYDKVLNTRELRVAARQRLLGELKQTGMSIAAFIAVLAGMAAVGSWIMGRTITNRISKLREGSSIIGKGNLNHRIDIQGDDEFADLSRAFNTMTEKLTVSYHELQNEIADRKRAEEAFRERDTSLRDAIDLAELGTWEYDATNSLLHFDERSRSMLGMVEDRPFTTEEFVALIHPGDRPHVQRAIDAADSPEISGTYEGEFRISRQNGTDKWVMVRGHSMGRNQGSRPSAIRFRGTVMDLTERKLTEEALRKSHDELELRVKERTAELERRNLELQDFVFIASHDLREPLRKVQVFGSLLAERSGERLNAMEKDYISRMDAALKRMQELLDALLRYSRIDTKGQEFSSVRLDNVLRESISDLELDVQSIGARIEIKPLPIVYGDYYQLKQLFQNLVANALKYHRSEIIPLVKIYGERIEERCRVFVEDNGIGFDEKYIDKIFQPFQRLHGKHEYSGTGIGLAICKKIVERHGGTITAQSSPGKGSTFIVSLPAGPNSMMANPVQQAGSEII